MKVTELVSLKLKLLNLPTAILDTAVLDLNWNIEQITNAAQESAFDDLKLEIKKTSNFFIENNKNLKDSIKDFIDQIDNKIDSITKDCLTRGYMLEHGYGSVECAFDDEKNRILALTEEQRVTLINVARKYTDWQYPTLEIGPGNGEWTDHLVAGDPLYIVDIHKEFLNSTVSKFTGVYQRRIRPYLIKSNNNPAERFVDLSILPTNQFGFIFSWNVFNYFPLRETQTYLEESFKLLRPGGVMMFSYNNCDNVTCAGLFENGMRSWMTEKLLIDTCKNTGFDIISSVTENEVNWVEIVKPGKLQTVKAHQVLGRILPIGS